MCIRDRFRGTGLDGLQGPMKKRTLGKGIILRPWLGYAKADLSEYLSLNEIEFITDDTNFEDNQDRNYIRNEVLKMASNRWPNASLQIQQTAELVSMLPELTEPEVDEDMLSHLLPFQVPQAIPVKLGPKTLPPVPKSS